MIIINYLANITFFSILFFGFFSQAEVFSKDILLVTKDDNNTLIVDTTGHQDYSKFSYNLYEKLNQSKVLKVGSERIHVPKKFLPPELRKKSIVLLTPKGLIRAKIIDVYIKFGASEAGLVLVTDKKDTAGSFSENIHWGITKINKPFLSNVKLRSIDYSLATKKNSLSGQDTNVSKIAIKFKGWVEANIANDRLEFYQSLQINLSNFRFTSGQFLRPEGKWLVWSDPIFSESDSENSFKVVAVLDIKGNPIEILTPPTVGTYETKSNSAPIFEIDIDSDGIKEVITYDTSYEGYEIILHQLKKGKAKRIILSSDSA